MNVEETRPPFPRQTSLCARPRRQGSRWTQTPRPCLRSRAL